MRRGERRMPRSARAPLLVKKRSGVTPSAASSITATTSVRKMVQGHHQRRIGDAARAAQNESRIAVQRIRREGDDLEEVGPGRHQPFSGL